MFTKELTKLILGVIVVGGSVYAAIAGVGNQDLLIGLAGLVIGYYFKDATGGIGAIFGRGAK